MEGSEWIRLSRILDRLSMMGRVNRDRVKRVLEPVERSVFVVQKMM